jgi:hypothetical protein
MEHRRPDGSLSQGWYCARCGKPLALMYGHTNQDQAEGVCIPNPKLVKALHAANVNPAIKKPHFVYRNKDV